MIWRFRQSNFPAFQQDHPVSPVIGQVIGHAAANHASTYNDKIRRVSIVHIYFFNILLFIYIQGKGALDSGSAFCSSKRL